MKNYPVTVLAPSSDRTVISGVIAVNPNKEGFGSIMVEQKNHTIGLDGFCNVGRNVAFIAGELDNLKELVENTGITVGCDLSEVLGEPQKLVVMEQSTPWYEGQSPKINPKTNEVLADNDGQPIYRKVAVVAESAGINSTLIPHQKTSTQVRENIPAVENVMSND